MDLSINALKVAQKRYFKPGEDWEGCCRRVAKAVASVEVNGGRDKWEEKFFECIYNMKFLPGGRVLRNAGTYKNSVLNCHSIPLTDSIEGIGDFISKALVLNAEGGGIGFYANLRPKGAPIKRKGGKSSGLLSFLDAISYVLDTVETGGNRRSGGLPIVPVSHPEILDFIDCKLDKTKFNNFNISVGITNKFLDAVEQDKDWDLEWEGKVWETIKAKALFEKICHNMHATGEPGIINLDQMRISNSFYYAPISSLNLCAELKLQENSSCCLGSIVLPAFVSGSTTRWETLRDTIHTLVRFLDNVLDLNTYTFSEMEDSTLHSRRLGIGYTGLADYLFKKQVRYGSESGLVKVEESVKFLRNEVYTASIELAKERGVFPGYNRWAYPKAKFIKTLPPKIRMAIKEHGIRNVSLMSFAPAGSISMLPECTSGVEPLFAKGYLRKDAAGERVYINPIVNDFVSEGKLPEWFVDVFDLSPTEHLETSLAIQKLNDGSISKTINVPNDITVEELSSLLLEYARDLVGITVYRDGSRPGQILNRLAEDDIFKHLKLEHTEVPDEDDGKCTKSVCDI